MTTTTCSRRKFIGAAGATAGAWLAHPVMHLARPVRASRVSVAVCREYGPQVVETLGRMFDQLGGLEGLVAGKTVAMKLNLTGAATDRLGHLPPGITHWVHPQVIGATAHLLGKAGAQRIRLLESPWYTDEPLEEFMLHANWEPRDFLRAAARVELENTNYLGRGKKYSRLWVPGGGLMFNAYDVHPSYENCDVFVSLAKLKEHNTLGVALAMKNCFGITPCTIYGESAQNVEPGPVPRAGRASFNMLNRVRPRSAPPEADTNAGKDLGYGAPRMLADLAAARPIHLAIIDGIHSMAGGEGPWSRGGRHVRPGLLIAGTNCVPTDAVGMALMGFDSMAGRGTPPFERCDSTLQLAAGLGLGSRDLDQIEVLGTPIAKVRFDFGSRPAS